MVREEPGTLQEHPRVAVFQEHREVVIETPQLDEAADLDAADAPGLDVLGCAAGPSPMRQVPTGWCTV
jgi:hypothetical protein